MDVTAIVFAAIAVVVTGIALFFWKKTASAKNETTLANVKTAQLQEDKENLTADLASERNELARVRAESAARAGFESLATERERTITGLSGELDRLREELKAKSDETRTQGESIKKLETELENERKNLVEKLALLEGAKQTLSNHFQTLAGDILETKSKTFSDTNKTEIGTLLNPLREQIRDFREKVEKVQTENLVGRTELSAKLEQLKDLNERLSTEAQALTNALTRDTSEQGHWGELVLLDILEACDLKRGLHYTYQQTFVAEGEDGLREERKRTDVILRFPEGRSLIIDSKVTLTAHKEYVEAADENSRNAAREKLIASIRNHVRQLSSKNYQELVGERSPDYVVLFAPNEAAYLMAVQEDPKLITDAYKSRVLIAGPTTILHIARIVDSLWRNEDRAKSLKQIGHRARLLFEEFTRFVDALETVRTSILKAAAEIRNAEQSNNEAIKRLTSGKSNLVGQAEKLGRLADKSTKQIASRVLDMADEDDDAETPLSLAAETEGGEI